MSTWSVVKDWSFEGHVEGSDTAGGHAYRIEHGETDERRELSILLPKPPTEVGRSRVEEVLQECLELTDPPRYVTIARDGSAHHGLVG